MTPYQVVILFGLVLLFNSCEVSEARNNKLALIEEIELPDFNQNQEEEVYYMPFNGNYDQTFNELHELHIEEASRLGFNSIATRKDTSRLKGKIVRLAVGEHKNFVVDSLPHSMPIMIPAVAELIEEIGIVFRDSLMAINYPDCKLIVTSIMRTEDDINKLRRINGNAIHESAHRFGTTFDISWASFKQVDTLSSRTAYDSVLKKTLGKVLNRMQQEQKCYVKYETHQKCFHITIRKNG